MSRSLQTLVGALPELIAVPLFLCCLPVLAQSQRSGSLEQRLLDAIDNRNLVAVEHSLDQGANIESRATNGVTPLMTAAEGGSVSIVSLLLEHGADAGARDNQDETALVYAARGGYVKLVNLLARFSDTKTKNRALFAAAESGPVSIEVDPSKLPKPPQGQPVEVEESWTATAESLLDSGADIEARNEDGSTPLIWAASFAQADTLNVLIRRGARLDVTDNQGNTPLIAAACECALATMNSAYGVVKLLLDHGARVNARSKDGTTALMNAAAGFGGVAIVKMLLDNGANPRLRNRQGDTALTLAQKRHREDKARLIREALGRHN